MMLRLFIAIPLPEEIVGKLESFQAILRDEFGGAVKWVKANSLHITAKFIGETLEANINGISNTMDEIAQKYSKANLKIEKLGFFPSKGSPRVLWAGINDATLVLPKLHKELDIAMQAFGVDLEQKAKYNPHITLGRVKKATKINVTEGFKEEHSQIQFGEFEINSLILYRSELTPRGPIYTPLHTSSFQ